MQKSVVLYAKSLIILKEKKCKNVVDYLPSLWSFLKEKRKISARLFAQSLIIIRRKSYKNVADYHYLPSQPLCFGKYAG